MIDTITVVDNLMRLHIFTGSQTKLTGKIKSYPYTKIVGICVTKYEMDIFIKLLHSFAFLYAIFFVDAC